MKNSNFSVTESGNCSNHLRRDDFARAENPFACFNFGGFEINVLPDFDRLDDFDKPVFLACVLDFLHSVSCTRNGRAGHYSNRFAADYISVETFSRNRFANDF
jgi:hypothetical protein